MEELLQIYQTEAAHQDLPEFNDMQNLLSDGNYSPGGTSSSSNELRSSCESIDDLDLPFADIVPSFYPNSMENIGQISPLSSDSGYAAAFDSHLSSSPEMSMQNTYEQNFCNGLVNNGYQHMPGGLDLPIFDMQYNCDNAVEDVQMNEEPKLNNVTDEQRIQYILRMIEAKQHQLRDAKLLDNQAQQLGSHNSSHGSVKDNANQLRSLLVNKGKKFANGLNTAVKNLPIVQKPKKAKTKKEPVLSNSYLETAMNSAQNQQVGIPPSNNLTHHVKQEHAEIKREVCGVDEVPPISTTAPLVASMLERSLQQMQSSTDPFQEQHLQKQQQEHIQQQQLQQQQQQQLLKLQQLQQQQQQQIQQQLQKELQQKQQQQQQQQHQQQQRQIQQQPTQKIPIQVCLF